MHLYAVDLFITEHKDRWAVTDHGSDFRFDIPKTIALTRLQASAVIVWMVPILNSHVQTSIDAGRRDMAASISKLLAEATEKK